MPVDEKLLPSLLEGLHAIGGLSQVHESYAILALKIIGEIYATLRAGLTGELSPEAVADSVKALRAGLAANDRAADAALAAKFDTGGEG